jgi:hypothetical protein
MVMGRHEPSATHEGTGHGPQGGSAHKSWKGQAQSLALVKKSAMIEWGRFDESGRPSWEGMGLFGFRTTGFEP